MVEATSVPVRRPIRWLVGVVAPLALAGAALAQTAPVLDVGVTLDPPQAACESFPETRFALVIGNGSYVHTSVLNNPMNDSLDVASALAELCFKVTLLNDLDQVNFERTLRAFRDQARGADLALVFYAGHGIEIAGRNYLIPVDAQLARDVDVEWEAVDVDRVLRATAGALRQIVILDACRDNPLARSMQRSALTRGSNASGLAPPGTVDNQLVAYAAAAGNTAADGRGRNSPYTEALLRHLAEPGLEINILFGRVRDSVRASTEGGQVPGFYNQLPGEPYYLNPGFEAPPAELVADEAVGVDPAVAPVAAPAASAAPLDAALDVGDGRLVDGFLQGQLVVDCPYCPQLVIVPPGSFIMGGAAGEFGREEDEGPQHVVTIGESLAVGMYEVSFREWDACVDASGCNRRPNAESWGRADRPVINVSWSDAREYVAWLTEETGNRYRLLSEAEWEYVARAGTSTARYWDARPGTPCEYANSADVTGRAADGIRWPDDWSFASCEDGFEGTAPVGAFQPNRFRLQDLLGNVWEWTADCWNDRYVRAPGDGAAWEMGDCDRRVVRGGAWNSQPMHVRAAVRDGIRSNTRSNNLGFRVARVLEAPSEADESPEVSSDDGPDAGDEPDRPRDRGDVQ